MWSFNHFFPAHSQLILTFSLDSWMQIASCFRYDYLCAWWPKIKHELTLHLDCCASIKKPTLWCLLIHCDNLRLSLFKDYNSLTCDSGFCAILPKTVRTNSICEPLAETTKKVGRFQIGIVKEQVSPARSPSPGNYHVMFDLLLWMPPELVPQKPDPWMETRTNDWLCRRQCLFHTTGALAAMLLPFLLPFNDPHVCLCWPAVSDIIGWL